MTTAVAKIDGTVPGFKAFVENQKERLADVISKYASPERVVKMALVAAANQPGLYKANPVSVVKALMQSAETGLDCSGTGGKAYLIMYGNDVVFMPGYRGFIELATRSGAVRKIEARVVYEKDTFVVELGTNPYIMHTPAPIGEPHGPPKAFYAIAFLPDGSTQFEVMAKADVDAIRKRSKAGSRGPWVTDYEEMAKKTVVRRLWKYLPTTREVDVALEAAEQADIIDVHPTSVNTGRTTTRTQELLEAIEEKAPEEPPPSPPQAEPEAKGSPAPEDDLSPDKVFEYLWKTAEVAEWSKEDLHGALDSNGAETTALELGAPWPQKGE